MATNVNLNRKEKENTMLMMKRFTRIVRSAGVVPKLKSLKFQKRQLSKLKRQQSALRRIRKTSELDMLRKLGKVK